MLADGEKRFLSARRVWFGFLNDHSGLGRQTLPITKTGELVLPFLEVSNPM